MARAVTDLDHKWRLIAETILIIGRPCTIYEIACHIEKSPLPKNSWKIDDWRILAHGSERSKLIIVNRNNRPYKYSLSEYGWNNSVLGENL